jgi:hypothetical protein
LPNPAQIREQVLDTLAGLDVPHLQRPVRTRDDLLRIVLEAGDSSCMCAEGGFALSVLWIPYP